MGLPNCNLPLSAMAIVLLLQLKRAAVEPRPFRALPPPLIEVFALLLGLASVRELIGQDPPIGAELEFYAWRVALARLLVVPRSELGKMILGG